MIAAMERGYSDNRWMTFKQMEDKGWSFKRNAEGKSLGRNAGVAIEYFELRDRETKQPFDRHTLDGMTADERNAYMEGNVYPLRKYYRVFNGDVIEGIPALERKKDGRERLQREGARPHKYLERYRVPHRSRREYGLLQSRQRRNPPAPQGELCGLARILFDRIARDRS